MKVVNNVYELIGRTPMVKLNTPDTSADVFLKLEWFNPGGSVKDRIALHMIEDAVHKGTLKQGDTIVEPTSGNTGIGIAMIAPQMNMKACLVMPDSVSKERIMILEAYGAEVILTPKEKGMKESIRVADDLVTSKGYVQLHQFDNKMNPDMHYHTTAVEILEQVPVIDCFVASVGTGGTITGNAKRLKETKEVLVVAVEPKKSSVLSGNPAGPHGIQGIGAGFIPGVVELDLIDEIYQCTDEDAFETARKLAKEEGLMVGISTGANVFAAMEYARRLGPGKVVVTISPSNGERYLSTDLYKK